MNDVLFLVTHGRVRDSNGVWRDYGETLRQVLCEVNSVSRAEFFDGGQTAHKPEWQFTVFHAEYHGEDECEYNGVRYSIYRTYRSHDMDYMELYAERKAGV